jgi:hypothetical protein
MTKTEIATRAERVSKVCDRDQRDARAMLRQIDQDHGCDIVRAVIEQMQLLSECRPSCLSC